MVASPAPDVRMRTRGKHMSGLMKPCWRRGETRRPRRRTTAACGPAGTLDGLGYHLGSGESWFDPGGNEGGRSNRMLRPPSFGPCW